MRGKLYKMPIILKARAFKNIILNKNSYLYKTGWMKSISELKPIDEEGKPIPWMNYCFIEFLKEKLDLKMNCFEYGSGYSSLFLARYVETVTSVEYNEKWYRYINEIKQQNVEIIYVEQDVNGQYCRASLLNNEKYDIIFVDGRDRINCIINCITALTEKGIIVLDDSHLTEYEEGFMFLKNKDFRWLNFTGLKPYSTMSARTTIFYRDRNCFNI